MSTELYNPELGEVVRQKQINDLFSSVDPRNRTMIQRTARGAIPMIPQYATSNPVGTLTKKTYDNTLKAQDNLWLQNHPNAHPALPQEEKTDSWHPPMALATPQQEPVKGGADTSVPKALGYDPYQENAIRGAFDQAVTGYDSRMRPALDKMDYLADQYQNAQSMGSSFGGLMANMHTLEGMNSAIPAAAKMHEQDASSYGALSSHFMPQLGSAITQGSKNQDESEMERFKSALPLNKAHTALYGAQADKAKKDSEKTTTKHEDRVHEIDLKAREMAIKEGNKMHPQDDDAAAAYASKAYDAFKRMGEEEFVKQSEGEPGKTGGFLTKDTPAIAAKYGWQNRGKGGEEQQRTPVGKVGKYSVYQ